MASPGLLDPNFHRSVVLVVEHDGSGTMGVVLNRAADIDAEKSLPHVESLAAPNRIFVGGPVQPDHGLALAAGSGPFSIEIPMSDGSIGMVAPETESVTVVRYFAGYAGWIPGQLDAELEEPAWWVVEGFIDDVFTPQPADLWKQVLRRQRGPLALLASFPDDVTLN